MASRDPRPPPSRDIYTARTRRHTHTMTAKPFTRALRYWTGVWREHRARREFCRPVSVGWLERHRSAA